MLQYHFNWKTLSAMAGVTWWNFYFRLFPGTIRSPQVIEFLEHLLRHIPGKLLVVWDGLTGHRSRRMALKITPELSPAKRERPRGHFVQYRAKENRSVRASSSLPRACSGDM